MGLYWEFFGTELGKLFVLNVLKFGNEMGIIGNSPNNVLGLKL